MKAQALKKQPLFYFSQLRAPQQADISGEYHMFVRDEQKAKSYFLKDISQNMSKEEAHRILVERAQKYKPPRVNMADLELEWNELYHFSHKLVSLPPDLPAEKIEHLMEGVKALSEKDRRFWWDALYYQLITAQSDYMREFIIRLLKADHFVRHYAKWMTARMVEELIKAPLLIDPVFGAVKHISTLSVPDEKLLLTELKKQWENDLVRLKFNQLTKIEKELHRAYQRYENEKSEAFFKAYHTYRQEILKEWKSFNYKDYPEKQWNEIQKAVEKNTLPLELPANINIPEFTFEFPSFFTEKYLRSLSADAQQWLASQSVNEQSDFYDLITRIKEEQNRKAAQLLSARPKKITAVIQNAVTELNGHFFPMGTVGLYFPERLTADKTRTVLLAVVIPASKKITEQQHAISFRDEDKKWFAPLTDVSLLATEGNLHLFKARLHLPAELIHETEKNIKPEKAEGSIHFGDGTKWEYSFAIRGNDFAAGKGNFSAEKNDPFTEAKQAPGIYISGISDWMRVEQEVCCYMPGEVSHIENIMAREYKERSVHTLVKSEEYSEFSASRETEEQKDTISTERFTLQQEVENILQQQLQTRAGISYGFSSGQSFSGTAAGIGGSATFTQNFHSYADMAYSLSRSRSEKTATEFAREITEQAKWRILSKISQKRTSKLIKQREEINKHGFDNRKGDKHVSGIYRWVDIIYKHELRPIGKRLVLEFAVPEPSRLFIQTLRVRHERQNTCQIKILEKPLHPSQLPYGLQIHSAEDIHEGNYLAIASYYNVEVPAPPPFRKVTGINFAKSQWEDGAGAEKNKSEIRKIDVPQGYSAASAHITYSAITSLSHSDRIIAINVGNVVLFSNYNFVSVSVPGIGAYTDKLPVSVFFNWIWGGVVNVTVSFIRSQALMNDWKNKVFELIMEAYEQRMAAYEEELQNHCREENLNDENIPNFYYALNRDIEQKELKRAAIEMLTAPFGYSVSADHFSEDTNGFVQIRQDEPFAFHVRMAKFFEEAIDWKYMAYTFYPYYWADKNQWIRLTDHLDIKDPLFRAFLQSGMARLTVPVRPGFEEAVLYYLETGDIWTPGQMLPEDREEYYACVWKDINDMSDDPVAQWYDRIPTSLTLIQSGSAGLKEEGLPCCNEIEFDNNGNPIQPEINLLGNDCKQDETAD